MPRSRIQLNRPETRSKERKPDRWIRDKDHLSFVRSLPCCVCGREPCDAAHVRNGTDGAMGRKPSDKWAVPLCRPYWDIEGAYAKGSKFAEQKPGCHRWQHIKGEESWWAEYGDPVPLAEHLWRVSGDMEAGLRAVERFRMKLAL